MSRLNSIEQECRDVLAIVIDVMAAGHSIRHHEHTEVLNKVRKAYFRLENKEYGCPTGMHRGACNCPKAAS